MFKGKDKEIAESDEERVAVLKETLEAAHRNLALTRMSLEYIDKLRLEANTRLQNLEKVIDRIERNLGTKKRSS